MERSEAREILRRWGRIDEEIENMEKAYKKICEKIDRMELSLTQSLSGMPHGQNVGRPTEQVALKRIEIAEKYRSELENLNMAIIEAEQFDYKVTKIILLCSKDVRRVAVERYKNGLTMEKIAETMNVSVQTVYRYKWNVQEEICKAWM